MRTVIRGAGHDEVGRMQEIKPSMVAGGIRRSQSQFVTSCSRLFLEPCHQIHSLLKLLRAYPSNRVSQASKCRPSTVDNPVLMEGPSTQSDSIVLHIWPGVGIVPSYDPSCFAALVFLQIAIKGRFVVEYCGDPDSSPSGQLPFLTHGTLTLAGLAPILSYAMKFEEAVNPDEHLSNLEKAQLAARIAHIESEGGDLLAHLYYSVGVNWYQNVRPAISAVLPIPQRYYVPERLRNSYKPRLMAAGLWITSSEAENEGSRSAFQKIPKRKAKESQAKQKAKTALEREKVLEKARSFFDSYNKLLGNKRFFYGDSPSSLDFLFAVHIRLMVEPLAEPVLQDLLFESYTHLVSLSRRAFDLAFPGSNADFQTIERKSHPTFPSLTSLLPHTRLFSPKRETTHSSPNEKRFKFYRWGFIGISAFIFIGYIQLIGLLPTIARAVAQARAEAESTGEVEDDGGGEDALEDDEEEDEVPSQSDE